MYVKVPVVRATISFNEPIHYVLGGAFVEAVAGVQLFSGMADALFKFESTSKIGIATTGFTRIRLSVIIRDKKGTLMERLVFLTSQDRTLVATNSARLVNEQNYLQDVEHNTPLVLCFPNGCSKVLVNVAESSGNSRKFEIGVTSTANGPKFQIPDGLDVKCRTAAPNLFDADFASKKMKRY